MMILNSFSQLFIDDNRRPLRQWLSWWKMSALIPTSSIFSGSSCTPLSSGLDKFNTWDCSCQHAQGCSRPFGCGWCPSMQQSGPSLPSVFVCLLHDLSFIPFPLSPLHLESTLLGMKNLVFILLGSVARSMRLTLDSRRSLIRTSVGIRTSFFPSSHLRVSCTLRTFRLLEEFCLTDTLCRETRQHVLAFRFKRIRWRASSRSFIGTKFVHKVCKNTDFRPFPALSKTIEFVVCLKCFGFSPIVFR